MADTTIASEPWNADSGLEDLEQRIQRLEDVVATMCDTQAMEERLRTRVVEQLRAEVEQLAPKTASLPASAEAELSQFERETGSPYVETPPAAPVAVHWIRNMSVFREIWWEVTTFVRMIRDPRYSMSWSAKTAPLLAIGYFVWVFFLGLLESVPLLGWCLKYVPLLASCLNFLVASLIAYLIFKVFGRELRRYHDFAMRRYAR